jgi:sortase A
MRKHKSTVVLCAVFLIGLSLLLYPVISNYVNEQNQTRAIAAYEKEIAQIPAADGAALRAAAQTYNADLASRPTSFSLTDSETQTYDQMLDPTGNGIMGSIEISSIGVSLPIYHGVSDAVLAAGVGHVPGSSLPVGGKSTHCVLSGHRGLPSSRLFTDLDQLQKGDLFLLHVLDETLAYEVDQIQIVNPDEIDSLGITPGEDFCTLVTCTPYGINTQRLLVRGRRVPYTPALAAASPVSADASAADPMLVASALAAPILLILFLVLLIRTRPGEKRPKEASHRAENQKAG